MYKKVLVSTIALALAGQLSSLGAKETHDDGITASDSQNAQRSTAPNYIHEVGRVSPQMIENARPMVDKAPDGLFITAPYIQNLLVMNVRVFDSNGNKVINTRSFGEPFALMALDLPNGKYHYEAVSVFLLDEPNGKGPDFVDEGISRNFGTFTIEDQALFDDNERLRNSSQQEDASILDRVIENSMSLAGIVLNALVPSANAANLVASSADPFIQFDDTSVASAEWNVWGNTSLWGIANVLGTNNHYVFKVDGTASSTLNANSIQVDSDGDIHWASNGMNFDKGSSELTIGSTSSPASISIYDSTPDLRFLDESDTSEAEFQLTNGLFQVWGREPGAGVYRNIIEMSTSAPIQSMVINSSGQVTLGATGSQTNSVLTLGNSTSARSQLTLVEDTSSAHIELGQLPNALQFEDGSTNTIMQFMMDAPPGSFGMASNGDVGVGTIAPSSSLHITRNDKTAQLKITDTSATIGNTNLMQLENTGGAQIGFKDTTRSYQWNFIGGRDFKINATTYAGTEFEVTREGNLNILGVLSENSDVTAKENIVPIDRQNVLDKIANLPISEWSYIDTPKERHIGPMAQDFHAAFGLGHSETLIATLDTAGVALAGIQALLEENNSLKEQNQAQSEQISTLAQRLEQLEGQQAQMQAVINKVLENQQSLPVFTSAMVD